MILLICGIKTNDTNEHINRLTENKLMVIRKEGWWGGRDWEFGIDMYIPFAFRMQCMELNAMPRGVYLPALGKVFCYPQSGHFH